MKITTILASILFLGNIGLSHGQDKVGSRIGVTYASFGENQLMQFQDLDCAASYDSDNFFTVGLSYIYPLNHWLLLETGLEYAEHKVIVNAGSSPNTEETARNTDFSVINIPLSVRVLFWKYFFVNSGLMLSINTSKESEVDLYTGIGGLVGIGMNYDFANGLSAFVNPYIKAHSLIPFSDEQYPLRLMESGVRIGITYTLNRKQKNG